MSTPLICALLLAAGQAPASSSAVARVKRDSARRDTAPPTLPPPTIVVEAPSQWPTVVLGVAGLILLGLQLRIMARQTDAMNRQTTLLDKQTVLLDQQAAWRRDDAIGTFYRLAHDLIAEFRKANVMPLMPIDADFDTHPRHMLREASRLFAPLGSAFLLAANQAAMRLDEYFLAVQAYNRDHKSREGAGRLQTVQSLRTQVGGDLDLANSAIPERNRWVYADGSNYNFRKLCSRPPGFPFGPETETGAEENGA